MAQQKIFINMITQIIIHRSKPSLPIYAREHTFHASRIVDFFGLNGSASHIVNTFLGTRSQEILWLFKDRMEMILHDILKPCPSWRLHLDLLPMFWDFCVRQTSTQNNTCNWTPNTDVVKFITAFYGQDGKKVVASPSQGDPLPEEGPFVSIALDSEGSNGKEEDVGVEVLLTEEELAALVQLDQQFDLSKEYLGIFEQ